jgi:hypothetical protein
LRVIAAEPTADTKEIELHDGEQPRRRLVIDTRCSVVNLPVLCADGFGLISYAASGLRTDDGVEIWTPQVLGLQ